jgi:hypothetical protein
MTFHFWCPITRASRDTTAEAYASRDNHARAATPLRSRNKREDQADRGGGTGGARGRVEASCLCGANCRVGLGGYNTHDPASPVNSNLASSFCKSCFRSCAFPAFTSLHNSQGYLPLKVFSNAMLTDSFCQNFAVMPTQAADCSNAQCPPIITTSATTTSHLPKRSSTTPTVQTRPRAVNPTRCLRTRFKVERGTGEDGKRMVDGR